MKMSDEAIEKLVISSEGYKDVAYKPVLNDPWTIGYGHTLQVKEGDVCTKAQALAWLKEDLEDAEIMVARFVTVPLNQSQFDALVDLVYNIGIGNFLQSTLLKKLNKLDYDGASKQFNRWVYAHGKIYNGLVKRRLAETAWFNGAK